MSFKSKNLDVLAYANGFTFWIYKTEDRADSLLNFQEYFADALMPPVPRIKPGDALFINAKTVDGKLTSTLMMVPDFPALLTTTTNDVVEPETEGDKNDE